MRLNLASSLHLAGSLVCAAKMDESKLRTTPADIERALVESLAAVATPSPDDDDGQPDGDGTAEGQDAYHDGDLPEFSDSEEPAVGPSATPRLVPSKSAKGPAGRKKVPLSALKNRIQVGSSSKKSAAASTSASAATSQAPPPSQDKGKGKAFKLSDKQLDVVAERIAHDHPELPKMSPDQVQELLAMMQIDKDVIMGKKGFMGKGAKDMACVSRCLS